jgi:hypothetical protein
MAVLVTAIHDFKPHPRGTEVVDTRHSPGMTRELTRYPSKRRVGGGLVCAILAPNTRVMESGGMTGPCP